MKLKMAFQSSVRINVGPNLDPFAITVVAWALFQSSVRINVGPNIDCRRVVVDLFPVSILRED